jgi:hypothetical protein
MSKRVQSVQDLLLRALEIADPQERARFLAEACGTDLALRIEVEELIRAAADAGGFLPARPAIGPPEPNPSPRVTPDGNDR